MLEEKIETLTKEIVALRQAIEANGTGGGSTAKATTKAAAKEVEPEHDADEVSAIVKKAAKRDKPAMQAAIKKAKCKDLADVLTKPAVFDAIYAAAEAIVDAPEDDDDDV